jgi:hypothetical protein
LTASALKTTRADHSLDYNPLSYRDQVASDVIRRMEGDCTIVTNRETRITITADDMRTLLSLCSVTVTRTGRLRAHYTKKAPDAAPTAGGDQPNPTIKKGD